MIDKIDVVMPTLNSENVIGKSLYSLSEGEKFSNISIEGLIVIDSLSSDSTIDIVNEYANEYGWEPLVIQRETTLPEAREIAIQKVQTPWFLFLDDDVRISEEYLHLLAECVAPRIGAVQGRKRSSNGKPWEWTQRRIYRGGTHATLIRTEAVRNLRIPEDILVLEDEYIRRYIEGKGYIWVFNHISVFEHDSMGRHKLGWSQGRIAGRHGLMPFYSIILLIGDAIYNMKSPIDRLSLMVGWLYGKFFG